MSSDDLKPKKVLDATGLYCPEPIFRLRTAMDELEEGDLLEMVADDPAADDDVHRWAKRTGNLVLDFQRNGHMLRFVIQKRARRE